MRNEEGERGQTDIAWKRKDKRDQRQGLSAVARETTGGKADYSNDQEEGCTIRPRVRARHVENEGVEKKVRCACHGVTFERHEASGEALDIRLRRNLGAGRRCRRGGGRDEASSVVVEPAGLNHAA